MSVKKYKVAFATGSRADYGIVRHYLEKMNNCDDIDLSILVTGALLDEKYGHQVELIEKDGFNIAARINLPLNSSNNQKVIHSMAVALDQFGSYFFDNRYDLLIILGDRYEMLSVAVAAAMQNIPILHIHGGEATFGNYDEFIRHAITKMSLYHFAVTEEYRNRIIQLGEAPERVYNLGALGAENCININYDNVPNHINELPEKQYFVILFHPETLTNVSTLEQIERLIAAIDQYKNYKFVFIGSNADTNADIIRNKVKDYVENNSNTLYFENLHTDAYHVLLNRSICLIGNSSSGIIEAPSLGIHTINIGDRQLGRVRGNSVIDVECTVKDITTAIEKVIGEFRTVKPQNPYYKPDSVNKYFEFTKNILQKIDKVSKEPKAFYDIKI